MTTDRTPEDRADTVLRIIMARCPELSQADLALLGDAPDPDVLPASIGEQILEVVTALADRLDGFEKQLAPDE